MKSSDIRQAFLDFFQQKGHQHIRSSSLIPHKDPTILFTNAGMNQFKDYFLGNQIPEYTRAVTYQKVLRAGGKHNDLENVGRTPRHHTFFEMLGNFSFGDYFKKEAIEYAWFFLTNTLKIPEEKLIVSVYEKDDASFDLWKNHIGLSEDRIGKLGKKENFWSMGNTGPCGPCSEIHYDLLGKQANKTILESLEQDDGRFLEIWNLVFMEYNQDEQGTLRPLPKPSIDTGAGLERLTSVLQHVSSNYDTDLFTPILTSICKISGYTFGTIPEKDTSCRIIADHIRAACFLIADGVLPSNEGRGYVMRRIIRRAARHGRNLEMQTGFFSELSQAFIPIMSDHYPELLESKNHIQRLLQQEESRFSITLHQGMKILEEIIENLKKSQQTIANGNEIFKLYDTYGFPMDLAQDVLIDHGLEYDQTTFDTAMQAQKDRAKTAQESKQQNLKIHPVYVELQEIVSQNQFVGYQTLELDTNILSILNDHQKVTHFKKGDFIEVVLENTPFYAEGGGQVGDAGMIHSEYFQIKIKTTYSPVEGLNISKGYVQETTKNQIELKQHTPVKAIVNKHQRKLTQQNHTATHLLHAALRQVLGEHVKQAGSYVDANRLRFDFNHYAPVTAQQMFDIESVVNNNIQKNQTVLSEIMEYDIATNSGAMAIFGEKYSDQVRVITAGDSSKEFCGGCHTEKTGNIGLFKMIQETGIAAGVRRIEAITGSKAIEWMQNHQNILQKISERLKTSPKEVDSKVQKLLQESKHKDQTIQILEQKINQQFAEQSLNQIKRIAGIKTLILEINSDKALKSQVDIFKQKINSGVIMLAHLDAQKISVLITVTKDLTPKYHAGNIIRELSPLISARGGGKADMAQCGGNNPSGWETMKSKFVEWIQNKASS